MTLEDDDGRDGCTIAVVGSGPAGCYVAQALGKALPAAATTVFERLPVPYGLIRYGVAADHQGTKAIARQFERLFQSETTRFAGNVSVGVDLTIDDLLEAFDVVVLATGLEDDRALGVPGDDLARVHGAGRLTRALNAHPVDAASLADLPSLGEDVVIIGHGNVAFDLARLILKRRIDFDGSDIDDEVHDHVCGGVRRIQLIGRSMPSTAKFDPLLLAELGRIPGVEVLVRDDSGSDRPDDAASAARLRAVDDVRRRAPGSTDRSVDLHFGWIPEEIRGGDGVQTLHLADASGSGERRRIVADDIITAIGFHSSSAASVDPVDADRVFRTGWARRGPHGTIPENRVDAREVADEIAALVLGGLITMGRPGFEALPGAVRANAIDHRQWQHIDRAERDAAATGRVRRKLRSLPRMLEHARFPTGSEGADDEPEDGLVMNERIDR